MKFIKCGLIISLLGISSQVSALECEVSYKAKKEVVKKNLIRKTKVPEYKVGIRNGAGKTKKECKDNALQSLINNQWKITYASVTVK